MMKTPKKTANAAEQRHEKSVTAVHLAAPLSVHVNLLTLVVPIFPMVQAKVTAS
jgi:hypothetical protein